VKHTEQRKRYRQIALAYAVALGPELANVNVRNLLPAVFAAVPDMNAQEIAAAIRWALREANRAGARFERRMFGHPRPHIRRPRLRLVQ
jgi:hypothetical protein